MTTRHPSIVTARAFRRAWLQLGIVIILLAVTVGCVTVTEPGLSASPPPAARSAPAPEPESELGNQGSGAVAERDVLASIHAWERHMRDRGQDLGRELLLQPTQALRLHAIYYDSNRVFRQIAAYTGDEEPWLAFAGVAEDAYREYMSSNDFGVAGWMRFPHGFYLAGTAGQDPEALKYLRLLRDKGAFADADKRPSRSLYQQRYSREVAYLIQTHVLADKAGKGRRKALLGKYVDMALAHVAIWTSGNYLSDDPDWQFVQPFMAGLTASALIDYHQLTIRDGNPDGRIPPALGELADWLWNKAWVADLGGETGGWNDQGGSGYGAFRYVMPPRESVGSNNPAPDLNMLILPLYVWLHEHTGEARYLDQADRIFVGGVQLGSLITPKQFNQHYRDSFHYVELRSKMLDKG